MLSERQLMSGCCVHLSCVAFIIVIIIKLIGLI